MRKLLLILAVTLGLVSSQAAAVKISEYERLVEIDEDEATFYISGIIAGIRAAHLASKAKNNDLARLDLFCPGEGVRLGGRLAKEALQTFKDTKEGEDPDVSFAVLLGLVIMFPCN